MPKELPAREEIEEGFTWNLDDIYQSNEEWEQDFEKVKQKLEGVKEFQGKLTVSGEKLLEGIELVMNIEETAVKLYAYAHLSQDQDTRNQENQALYNRAQDLHNEISSTTSFMIPEILQLEKQEVEKYLEETPGLELYDHFLDNILRQKEHYLSAKEERLLAMSSDLAQGPNNIFSMLNNADLTFPLITNEEGEEVRLTHGRYIEFMKNKNRGVRKDAFDALYDKYDEFINTFATTLNSGVKSDIYFMKARKYDSSLAASLDDDNVPVDVYQNLVSTIRENLDPLHDYISIRKKILGLDELHMYDIYTPLVNELDIKIPFEKAKDTIVQGLQPLGEKYINILKEGFSSGWIDVYENRGKRSGAYSSGCYGVHPYVLLNYTQDVNNMFTLAHEMGHAIHTYYSNKNQPYVYANYKIFVAEVASTLNEALLIHYLLENIEDELQQKYYINYYLEQFRGTVYRQTMFAEFEKIMHERAESGQPLTPQVLKQIYHDLNVDYYGSDVIVDDKIDLEWARIPHFYYNFYVYKYATGFAAAAAMASRIIEEGQSAVTDYLEFLKSGASDYPLQILKTTGIDMTSPEPIESAIDVFREYLDEFTQLA